MSIFVFFGSKLELSAQSTWCRLWDTSTGFSEWGNAQFYGNTFTVDANGIATTEGGQGNADFQVAWGRIQNISYTITHLSFSGMIVDGYYSRNWGRTGRVGVQGTNVDAPYPYAGVDATYTNQPINLEWNGSVSSGDMQVNIFAAVRSNGDNISNQYGYISEIELRGIGTNPFGIDNCNLPTPTPTITQIPSVTPTPTQTAIPPTSPPNNNPDVHPLEICPDMPVDSENVSNEYRSNCSHCIGFPSDDSPSPTPNEFWYTQTAEYAGTPSTQEATPTIMYGSAPTDVVTVSTQYYASPTPQDSMPSAQNYSCSSFPCNDNFDAVTGTIVSGELQSDDVGSERLITVRYNAPIVSGFPLQLNFVSMGYTLSQPTYTGLDGFISVRNATGIVIFETWFDASSSSFIIEPQETYGGAFMDWSPSAATSIWVSLYASRQAPLDGSVTVTALSMSVEDPATQMFNADEVVCSDPSQYPFEQRSIDDIFSFSDITITSEPTCLPLMIEIDATQFISALASFISVSAPEWIGIPAVELCVTWQSIPNMTVFEIEIPIIELISAAIVGFIVKTMLRG